MMAISREQSIRTDMTALLALCEKSDHDIRSCLATLYFLKSQKRQLRYGDIVNLNIGQKDVHKSLFQVPSSSTVGPRAPPPLTIPKESSQMSTVSFTPQSASKSLKDPNRVPVESRRILT